MWTPELSHLFGLPDSKTTSFALLSMTIAAIQMSIQMIPLKDPEKP